MDKEHRESVVVQVNHLLSDMHCYLVLNVVVSLIVVQRKRPSARYKEVHVHVIETFALFASFGLDNIILVV